MALPPIYGHAEARRMLAAAARAGTLTQSLLLHGPAGIGKERMGMWLAQLALCEEHAPDGAPCGSCRECRTVDRLEHPDVHWFFPLPRPDAATPEKLRDKLEEHRGVELEARRADPHHVPAYDKAPAYFLGTIQNLQRIASVRPAVGSRKVFVVGDAETMVPQESSPEAANAFLKLLEEPPADTMLVLTSSNPGALLPTIRSRVLPIRLLPPGAEAVADFLVTEKGLGRTEAEGVAAVADGAPGKALRMLPSAGGAGALQKQRETGRALLLAALDDAESARFAAAHAVAPAGARGDFSGGLDALALWLRDLMAVTSGAADHAVYAGDAGLLRRLADRPGMRPERIATAILRVQEGREMAGGNVNPQLILAAVLRGVRRELRGVG